MIYKIGEDLVVYYWKHNWCTKLSTIYERKSLISEEENKIIRKRKRGVMNRRKKTKEEANALETLKIEI